MFRDNKIMKFQKYTKKRTIEELKNRWADNKVPPYGFFLRYFQRYSKKGYDEFLEIINVREVITPELKKAMADFWECSK